MRKFLLCFDLSVCSAWVLNILCGDINWSVLNTCFVLILVVSRITMTFTLERKDKKAWFPLLVFVSLCVYSTRINCRNGVGDVRKFFFHLTGLENNWLLEHSITGSVLLWIVLWPIVYYLYLLWRHKLYYTNVTNTEICGAILWKYRKARFYIAMIAISFITCLAGIYMEHRLCQVMCIASPSLVYWVLCRYYRTDADKLWLIIVGCICFWYAQIYCGTTRITILAMSFCLIGYTCGLLYKKTKQYMLTICATLYIGILLPSFAIGYNQYACIGYPRIGFGHLTSYNGILLVGDEDSKRVGIRDRYGLLIKPEYEGIRPGRYSLWGKPYTFLLEKDGYAQEYNISENHIEATDNNPELQKELCSILKSHFENSPHEFMDCGYIVVSDLAAKKVIGKVKCNRNGISYQSDLFPNDSVSLESGRFSRMDSISVYGKHYVNSLSYVENIPNDSNATTRIYVRLVYKVKPHEEDIIGILNKVRRCKTFRQGTFSDKPLPTPLSKST